MKKLKIFLFCTALLASGVTNAAIDALNFNSLQQEEDYHQLTQQLRCPQCQNNNIADSNATIAVDMRAKVFELLQQGKSQQDIVQYMVDRYGDFVTYDPPLNVATVFLWIVPLGLLVAGGWFIFRRKPSSLNTLESAVDSVEIFKSDGLLSEQEQQRLQALLNKERQS